MEEAYFRGRMAGSDCRRPLKKKYISISISVEINGPIRTLAFIRAAPLSALYLRASAISRDDAMGAHAAPSSCPCLLFLTHEIDILCQPFLPTHCPRTFEQIVRRSLLENFSALLTPMGCWILHKFRVLRAQEERF